MKKPSGRKLLRGLLGHAPVALEHVRPAHLEHADLARARARARPRPRPGARRPAAAARPCRAALAVQRVGRVHPGLGHAVALEDALARCAPRTRGRCPRAAAPSPRRTGGCRRSARSTARPARAGGCSRSARPSSRSRAAAPPAPARHRSAAGTAGARRRAARCCRPRTGRARGTAAARAGARRGSLKPHASTSVSALEARLRWVSIAPLARPVVPEV